MIQLPEGVLGVVVARDEWERLQEAVGGGPEVLSTSKASDLLGFSTKFWRRKAAAGMIPGAFRDDGDTGRWRLPNQGCRQFLANYRRTKRRGGLRGPKQRRGAAPPQAS